MPPEPLPWDRKDLFRETKHDRVDALGRWRDNSHHGSRVFIRGGSDDSRRPVGYGKQGSYRLFPEENGHGCTPSRSEDEIYRPPFVSRADGKYPANNRESKGSFSHKDWRGHHYHHQHNHSWEAGDASVNSLVRLPQDLSAMRSVDPLRHLPHTHSDVEKSPSWDQSHLKNQYDKMGGFDGLGTGHINNKDHSLGSMPWKPLKWTRSGSLSSRSSSMSTKSDFDDGRFDFAAEKESPLQSPSGDAAIGAKQAGPSDETCPKKKQRLGWGQGLAKYEKEKVEGPEEISGKTGLTQYDNNSKITLSITPGLPDTNPKVAGASDCTSPATPCSVAWSSSPGMEGKPYTKAENDDSTVHGFQTFPDLLSFKLENLELYSINNLSSVLLNLLQPEGTGSADYNCVSAMNKLLPFKGEILKALEKTECEIDMFEHELKSLKSEPKMSSPPIASKFLPVETVSNCCEEKVADALNVSSGSAQVEDCAPGSAAALTVRESFLLNTSFEAHNEAKGEGIDSPGTVTSRFGEPLSEKGAFVSDKVKSDEDAAKAASTGGKCFAPSFNGKTSAAVSGDEDENCLNKSSSAYVPSGISLQSEEDFNLNEILACNKISAREASDAFHKVLPTDSPQFDIWGADKSGLCRQNDDQIKKQLALRKRFLRFKERVLTLKFRALHHLWKEDMRLLSFRKYRAKSQKRFELGSRSSHSGYQKHRSSIRSRFTSPAGNLTLVPTTEIVDFTSRLLSDSQIKLYRNSLKMPALILDEKERRHSKFITSNGLVELPCAVEKEREMINPWTPDEKKIFLEMLAAFGKDFTKIASFLSHKTTADCVEFYYKNQKSESFENTKKTLKLKKQERCVPTNYLVTSGKKWNREANAASLDMLGAASVIAACADGRRAQQTYSGMSILGGYYDYKMSCSDDGMLETASSINILRNEREAAAADVLAGICGALSSEAMGSCITSSVDPGEGCLEWKCQKMNHMMSDRPLTPDVTQTIYEEDTCSDESCGDLDSTDWTDEEKSAFIRALGSYGKDFASISRCIRTRSRDQCKIFFSKARKCLGLDSIHSGQGNEGTPMSDANGGRSDTEDACVVEMDSAICSTQSCSKLDVDLPDKDAEGYGHAGNNLPNIEMDVVVKDERGGANREEGETMIENMIPDVCQGGIKVELVCNGDKERKGLSDLNPEVMQRDGTALANAVSCNSSLQLQEATAELFVDTEAQEHGAGPSVIMARSLSTEGPNVHNRRSRSYEIKYEIEPSSSEEAKLPKTESDDRLEAKSNSESNNRTSPSCFTPDSNGGLVSSQPVEDACIRPGFSFVPGHQHQISLELLPCTQKSQIISWKQKENCTKPGNSVLPESSSIRCYEEPLRQAAQPTLNFEGHNKQLQKSVSADFYQQQYLLGQHRVDQTLQIIRGYPLRIMNTNEIDGDADSISKKPVVLHGVPKIKNSQSNQFFGQQDLYPENCNGSKLPFRSPSSFDEAEEQSCKTGDVKLFGQVLSHPSSLKQKPNPQNVAEDKSAPPKSGKSFSLNFSEHTSGTSNQSPKLESSSYVGMDEFPLRSYGFWDGNRIQTGLSSLPDSTLLLAKYPGAFTDFPPIVKRNDRKSGVVPIFPAKDGSSNGGLGEYQLYRGYERANMQPFSVDVKQRHDVFSELQKRNGFETVSGRGGCTGVSDPVAAIKLHYAAERLGGGQSGIVSREEETWRGGDIGR